MANPHTLSPSAVEGLDRGVFGALIVLKLQNQHTRTFAANRCTVLSRELRIGSDHPNLKKIPPESHGARYRRCEWFKQESRCLWVGRPDVQSYVGKDSKQNPSFLVCSRCVYTRLHGYDIIVSVRIHKIRLR